MRKVATIIQTNDRPSLGVYGTNRTLKTYHDRDDRQYVMWRKVKYYIDDFVSVFSMWSSPTFKHDWTKQFPFDGYQDDTFFSIVVCRYDEENDGYKLYLIM